ncbi:HNH endonuclease [Streptomyces sp. BH055]|uniref:HNH endonuclease n=1 Tax=unclassified Streptomyces TaxID=2593676 RepID=UPI003BB5B893
MGRPSLPVWVWAMVLTANQGLCVYCGSRSAITLDHVIPLSRGGAHNSSNLVPSCTPCNEEKQARTPVEWFLQRELRSRWPGSVLPMDVPLRTAYEEAHQVVLKLLDHLEAVQGEIAGNKARRRWFRIRFGDYGKYRGWDMLAWSMGWANNDIEAAEAADWYQ